MATTEIYGLTPGDLVDRLGSSASNSAGGWFEIKAIFRKAGNSGWELFSAQITPTSNPEKGYTHQYFRDAFLCTYQKFQSPASIIEQISSSGIEVAPTYPPIKADKANWKEALIPAHASRSEYPMRHATFDLVRDDTGDNQLVAYGLPFYRSFHQRAHEFIEYANRRESTINVLVKDTRAALKLADGKVEVCVDEGLDVDVVGEIRRGEHVEKIGGQPIPGQIELADIDTAELWLIGKSGLVFDFISSSSFPYPYQPPKDELTTVQRVAAIAVAGESSRIEYKNYIDLKKGDSKPVEIVQTVCAFSNAEGGDLIIGVTDNIELVGIGEQVRKTYQISLGEALSLYRKDLNKLLYENLTESDCFDIYDVEISSMRVVCISVGKVSRWNFLTATDVPYIRKGSSNANATRLAVLEVKRIHTDAF